MYHAIVRAKVRRLWQRVGRGEYQAAVKVAAKDLRFRFVGDGPLGADLTGAGAFEDWFAAAFIRFPGLRLTLRDLVVSGWPWNTTVAVRLDIAATLADGTPYRNEGMQWVKLRWGRMTSDVVLEDTQRLAEACHRQERATAFQT